MGNHAAGLASSSGHSLEGTEQASTRVEVETLGVAGRVFQKMSSTQPPTSES